MPFIFLHTLWFPLLTDPCSLLTNAAIWRWLAAVRKYCRRPGHVCDCINLKIYCWIVLKSFTWKVTWYFYLHFIIYVLCFWKLTFFKVPFTCCSHSCTFTSFYIELTASVYWLAMIAFIFSHVLRFQLLDELYRLLICLLTNTASKQWNVLLNLLYSYIWF